MIDLHGRRDSVDCAPRQAPCQLPCRDGTGRSAPRGGTPGRRPQAAVRRARRPAHRAHRRRDRRLRRGRGRRPRGAAPFGGGQLHVHARPDVHIGRSRSRAAPAHRQAARAGGGAAARAATRVPARLHVPMGGVARRGPRRGRQRGARADRCGRGDPLVLRRVRHRAHRGVPRRRVGSHRHHRPAPLCAGRGAGHRRGERPRARMGGRQAARPALRGGVRGRGRGEHRARHRAAGRGGGQARSP